MKRKTKTGIKMLTQLVEKLPSENGEKVDYISPLTFLYRAYGHIVMEEYDKALKDYLKSNQLKKLNAAGYYDQLLCSGLKACENKEFETAISFFSKAQQKFPGNRDPYYLRAVSLVKFAL